MCVHDTVDNIETCFYILLMWQCLINIMHESSVNWHNVTYSVHTLRYVTSVVQIVLKPWVFATWSFLLLIYCYNCFQINSLFTTKSLRMHQKQSHSLQTKISQGSMPLVYMYLYTCTHGFAPPLFHKYSFPPL